MKKSELRKLIRESIKSIVNEQGQSTMDGIPISSNACHLGLGGSGGSSRRVKVNDNGTIRNPQVGDAYCMQIGQNHHAWNNLQAKGCQWKITNISNACNNCDWANGAPYVPGNNGCGSQCHKPPRIITLNTCGDPGCAGVNDMANVIHCDMTPIPNACPGWAGYSNWESTFTSLPNFSSSNPNQPCQFLCQRNTHWTNQISNAGPNWAAQLQCKLDKVQDLMNTHNCASSNAPAC